MPNVPGSWPARWTVWRKLSLNTWREPDDPTIYGWLDIDVGPLLDWLQRRSEASGVKCTLTHAVTRSIALTFRRHPEANVLVRGHRIWQRRDVDVFHQVAMPVDGGRDADLSGATVRHADTKRVEDIARELRDGALAVREKRDGEMASTRSLFMKLPGWLLRPILKLTGWLTYRLNLRLPTIPRDPFGGVMVTSIGMLGIRVAFAPP
ncbi:MAG: 2-oxo acid dehydrogenase subunit E2, partial [Deltaproteobacteria bacterium]|nr:2-oxo acid dehydrogenase subunit E2 [Deltaproteobacteria bacterium]